MKDTLLYIVDAFTSMPFGGNPAGVVVTETSLPEDRMQALAAELNLSETAFVTLSESDRYSIRWFTPTVEVDLCGHATLAASHILFTEGYLNNTDKLEYESASGPLYVSRNGSLYTLDFPANPPKAVPLPEGLEEALGFKPIYVGRNYFVHMVEAPSSEAVLNAKPKLDLIAKLDSAGVLITAQSVGDYDIVSRCFFPQIGVPEDPVTGAAHCAIGPYWAEKLGRTEFRAYQASKRGGFLTISVENKRVLLRGEAVTTIKGSTVFNCLTQITSKGLTLTPASGAC